MNQNMNMKMLLQKINWQPFCILSLVWCLLCAWLIERENSELTRRKVNFCCDNNFDLFMALQFGCNLVLCAPTVLYRSKREAIDLSDRKKTYFAYILVLNVYPKYPTRTFLCLFLVEIAVVRSQDTHSRHCRHDYKCKFRAILDSSNNIMLLFALKQLFAVYFSYGRVVE